MDKKTESYIKYQKNNLVRLPLNFNRTTDIDILEHLKTIDNKQGYIKRLIRQDINRQE